MSRLPDTRADLRRALAVNALTKPLNVLVPALVVVAGSLLGAAWLVVVALLCWLGLAAVTFFDEDEARRVGERRRAAPQPAGAAAAADPAALSPGIASRLRAALTARTAIRDAVGDSGLPLADVVEELDTLVTLLERHAVRADRIERFLAERSLPGPTLDAQRQALRRLEGRHAELLGEMDRIVAALDVLQAEILAADGLEEAALRRVAVDRVVELQGEVRLVSAGLEEAFEDTRADLTAGAGGTA